MPLLIISLFSLHYIDYCSDCFLRHAISLSRHSDIALFSAIHYCIDIDLYYHYFAPIILFRY